MAQKKRKKNPWVEAIKYADEIVLEESSLESLLANKKGMQEIIDFQADFYSELQKQRAKKRTALLSALKTAARSGYKASRWQRAVQYKYALRPLSAVGSVRNDVGGRFNIGNLDSVLFPKFPALYLAEDQETAIKELFCQDIPNDANFTGMELALATKTSFSIVSVSFEIERAVDLRNIPSLRKFVDIIKKFSLSKDLLRRAKRYSLPTPTDTIKNGTQLIRALLDRNWRVWPMLYDLPSNSQIFGQLVREAGIEGILYTSKMTGKLATAIFPKNFESSSSWIELDDEPPNSNVIKRIDAQNWELSKTVKQ
ncbi:MAG: RES family NAD+ phosphorylase [Nitrospinota bacterium]